MYMSKEFIMFPNNTTQFSNTMTDVPGKAFGLEDYRKSPKIHQTKEPGYLQT